MANYQIIKDPEELKKFIDWLPNLEKNETYYICLMVRSKYCPNFPHIRSDKIQVKRFLSTKERLHQKIAELECAEGTYYQKEHPIPQEGLAIYISPNPRDMEKATRATLIHFANLITLPYWGYNPQQEVMSQIQKAGGTRHFGDFDFDNKNQDREEFKAELLGRLSTSINLDSLTFLETRGGAHVLVEYDKINPKYDKTWYKSMSSIPGCDQITTNGLIPIPGCTQGNFIPKLYRL